MPTKRTAESEEDDYSVKNESDYTPPSTPKPKLNTKKPKATPSPTKSTTSSSNYIGDKSPKAIFGEMIILAGIKNLSKAEIYAATGFSPHQQKDMLREDKGSLRKALMAAVGGL